MQWSVTRREQLVLSASWDGSVRIVGDGVPHMLWCTLTFELTPSHTPHPVQWDPEALTCISAIPAHKGLVYQACWSPLLPSTFASVGGVHVCVCVGGGSGLQPHSSTSALPPR